MAGAVVGETRRVGEAVNDFPLWREDEKSFNKRVR
jgi:hypothetical protein